ncbi:trigger factor [Thermomonas carbonis]|uniref:Trigger factor n=1 Tax=Thermomonas carbonis TaxID=1463158 RepID=A0A7G9SMM9_9GAMM|nr:trigger factor [Thermomonas carbonis]QNN69104.1 trigger factor [Thermomonas carbonis]GHC06715.1 trigger factor [Thermomonas carbonis]
MQVSVESTGNLERRVILSLPAGDVDTQVGGRLREIARTVRIKGFRPGKVPTKVVEQRYGGQVRAEIVDGLLRQGMDQAVRENELRIAGAPQISQDVEAGEGELKYVASLELVPEFGDLDMTKLEVVRNTSEVTDADIERMLENLRQQRASWSKVERAAKTGDMANLETASILDGARMPAEGFEKTSTVLGSGAMYPEVEAAIAGMQPGEEKTIDVTLPADWHMPQFAGKTVTSTFKLIDIAEQVLPEVDAAFIRSFGVKSGDLEQFKAEIRSNLERELKGALMNRLRREVGEQLIAAYADIELPPRLVENEARVLLANATEQARRQGQQIGAGIEAFQDAGRKRVLVALLVGEVARRNELRLEQSRLNETMRLIASTYEQPEQVIALYRNDPQLMQGLQNRVMEEQVIDWIAERAQHTEQAIGFQEAIGQ